MSKNIKQVVTIKKEIVYEVGTIHNDWGLILRFRHGKDEEGEPAEGHRYWVDFDVRNNPDGWPGRVSVADMSGDGLDGEIGRPNQTDDGILWLDYGRPIIINDWGDAAIPVISGKDGSRSRTGERFADALVVAQTFGLDIMCGEYKLNITEAN